MRATPSINQNAYTSALPNFRNLGILLRILLIVNMCGIGAAVIAAPTLFDAWHELLAISALLQPLLIVTLLALVALNTLLHRLPFFLGAGEHARMSERAVDVEGGKALVEGHRRGEALDEIGDGLVEAPRPDLRVAARLCTRCHVYDVPC